MTDEMAFEMLSRLHDDAVAAGEPAQFRRTRQGTCRSAARGVSAERLVLPLVASAARYCGKLAGCPSFGPGAGGRAGRDIDNVNRSLLDLEYHGHLAAIVEARRIAWPFVKSSADIVPWGIHEFGEKGIIYEIYHYLEHTPFPDPRDRGLHDRIHFFIADARPGQVA